jgi:hypothetical protein
LPTTASTHPKPMPTLVVFHRGYTGRRPGEVEPALMMEKRRKSPAAGFAETGSPPATRGKSCERQKLVWLLKPESARRACLCGTHDRQSVLNHRDGFGRGTEVAGINRRNGARRVSHKKFSQRHKPCPDRMTRKTRVFFENLKIAKGRLCPALMDRRDQLPGAGAGTSDLSLQPVSQIS